MKNQAYHAIEFGLMIIYRGRYL